MNTLRLEIRAPGAQDPDAQAQVEAERGVPVEFQPESGAIGPHEVAPDEDDGTEPGDDL